MDLIYGTDNGNELDLGLPVHLPDELPSVAIVPDPIAPKTYDSQARGETSLPKQPVALIQGTDIQLKTQEDINEWIRQRKANWMKKISNNRPKESQEPKQELRKRPQKVAKPDTRRRGNNNKPQQQQPKPKFNLNKSLIQRELATSENLEIISFIKTLFESRTLDA